MTRKTAVILLLVSACAGCGERPSPAPAAASVPSLAATVTGAAVAADAPVNAAFWVRGGAAGEAEGVWLVAAGMAGLKAYAADGSSRDVAGSPEAGLVAVIPAAGDAGPLVIVYDAAVARLRAFRFEPAAAALRETMPEPLGVGDELTGLCHYRSRLSGSDYLFAVTDGGMIHQFELYAAAGGVAGRLLRSIPSGKGSGYCAADPRDGMLYVSEEGTGIWRLGAEPESDTTREPVDLRAPFGTLSDDVKGLAVYPVDAALSYLVAADAGHGRLAVYSLPDAGRPATVEIAGLREPEGVAATLESAGGVWPGGALAIADESSEGGGPDVKILAWSALAAALDLRSAEPGAAMPHPPVVRPVVETEIMPSFGDAADDPAIWVHPGDPAKSLVVGTDKQSGLFVFDLEGQVLDHRPDGRMNNVDLRDGFPLGGNSVALVTASNRSNDSIAAYRLDPGRRALVAVAAGTLPSGFDDPYGLCMYHSARSGEYYVFVNENGVGTFRQWRLFDDGTGRVAAEAVREFAVGSQAEGCVADDETGQLYVAEEDRGLWRYSAEPDGGDSRTAIDSTGDGGHLTDDVEGLSLWTAPDGRGYLVVSNQGADNYALYRRDGDNAFVGLFHIVANVGAGVDGASETDGLDVVSAPLGEAFPAGLLVVQDGRNIAPEERQNFKYVSWADVAAALNLVGAHEVRE